MEEIMEEDLAPAPVKHRQMYPMTGSPTVLFKVEIEGRIIGDPGNNERGKEFTKFGLFTSNGSVAVYDTEFWHRSYLRFNSYQTNVVWGRLVWESNLPELLTFDITTGLKLYKVETISTSNDDGTVIIDTIKRRPSEFVIKYSKDQSSPLCTPHLCRNGSVLFGVGGNTLMVAFSSQFLDEPTTLSVKCFQSCVTAVSELSTVNPMTLSIICGTQDGLLRILEFSPTRPKKVNGKFIDRISIPRIGKDKERQPYSTWITVVDDVFIVGTSENFLYVIKWPSMQSCSYVLGAALGIENSLLKYQSKNLLAVNHRNGRIAILDIEDMKLTILLKITDLEGKTGCGSLLLINERVDEKGDLYLIAGFGEMTLMIWRLGFNSDGELKVLGGPRNEKDGLAFKLNSVEEAIEKAEKKS